MENNILVIGTGAIGSIISAYLASDNNNKLTLIDPYAKAHLQKIKTDGLVLKKDGGKPELDEIISQMNVASSLDEIQTKPNIVIIATKAFSLQKVIDELKNRFSTKERKEMTYICLQNGYGNEAFVSNELDTNACRVAVNYLGSIKSPGEVRGHWLKQPNFIGAAYPDKENKSEQVAELMTKTGLSTEFVKDIRFHTYIKTVLNSTLCPICAATKTTMVEAMKDKALRKIVEEILLEGLKVAEAIGLKYDPEQTNVKKMMSYLEAGGNHPTSMRQDLQHGNITEIEWINGAIVRAGKEFNIKTPYNDQLTKIIKALEKTSDKAHKDIHFLSSLS